MIFDALETRCHGDLRREPLSTRRHVLEQAGPTTAYRADMDAVAMGEVSELEFRSQVPGAAPVRA